MTALIMCELSSSLFNSKKNQLAALKGNVKNRNQKHDSY